MLTRRSLTAVAGLVVAPLLSGCILFPPFGFPGEIPPTATDILATGLSPNVADGARVGVAKPASKP